MFDIAIYIVLFAAIIFFANMLGAFYSIATGFGALIFAFFVTSVVYLMGHHVTINEFYESFNTMLHTTFVLTGYLLWLILLIDCGFIVALAEYDKPNWFTALVIVTLAFLECLTDYRPITYAVHHPLRALIYIALYFVAATVWIIMKWYSHIHYVRRKFDDIKDELTTEIRNRNDVALCFNGQNLSEHGREILFKNAAYRLREQSIPLKVREHKAILYMWWACWPLSATWTIIHDPVRRVWFMVYDNIGSLLQSMSNKAFKP